jgi:hypothetical protein
MRAVAAKMSKNNEPREYTSVKKSFFTSETKAVLIVYDHISNIVVSQCFAYLSNRKIS